MKKKIFYLFVIFVLTFLSTTFAKDKTIPKKHYDFRKAKWGMTKRQVKRTEKRPVILEKKETIVYSDSVSWYDCFVVYFFSNKKLIKGGYIFNISHTNNNGYISDYNNIKQLLIKKYGKPYLDEQVWISNLFKNSPEYWGDAVSVGDLIYQASWKTPETTIAIVLQGDNYKIDLLVQYESKKFSKLVKKHEQKEDLNKF